MSKLFSFILLLFTVHLSMFAQEHKWMVYPSLGIDMGGAIPVPLSYIPDGAKGTPKLSPNIGLGSQYSINEKWSIGLDVNYHVLSFTANADVRSQAYWSDDRSYVQYFSGETHTDVELRFVEFPLTGLWHFGEKWSLVFGGYSSLILEGKFLSEGKDGIVHINKEVTDNAPLPGILNADMDYSDELDNYDAGILIGYQYKINSRFLFWGRMHFGMKSIFIPEFQNLEYDMYQLRLSTGISYALFAN